MKIMAIEREIDGAKCENMSEVLENEAQHVYKLYLSGTLREIYFTENKNAVLVLEAENKNEVIKIVNDFPLVKAGMIKFDIMELKPYTGLERLMHN